jgi:hypothetical protein
VRVHVGFHSATRNQRWRAEDLGRQRSAVCLLYSARCNLVPNSITFCFAVSGSNKCAFRSANSCSIGRTVCDSDSSTHCVANGRPYHRTNRGTNSCTYGYSDCNSDSSTICIAVSGSNKCTFRSANSCPYEGTVCDSDSSTIRNTHERTNTNTWVLPRSSRPTRVQYEHPKLQ